MISINSWWNMDFKDYNYSIDESGLIISFDTTRDVISSAPYNGGFQRANHIYNYRITSLQENEHDSIDETYKRLAKHKNLEGNMVGLMTAASLESFVNCSWESDEFNADIFLSAGLSNSMTAGDDVGKKYYIGTINTIMILQEKFSANALVETVMMLTESKIATMQDLDIRSYVSGKMATGTGTDAVLVVNGYGRYVEFCGKHTTVGRDMARLFDKTFKKSVMQAKLLRNKNS